MNYIVVIAVVSVLILLHEIGHFVAARFLGIPIAKFSIGFGPSLWGITYGKTRYQIAALPLGGYILPAVETEEELFRIPLTKRLLFTVAGPLANLMAALFCFALLNCIVTGPSFYGVVVQPFEQITAFTSAFLRSLPFIFSDHTRLSGIIGIVAQGNAFIAGSVVKTLQFVILLSMNFAILNMLPIPALDGGKIVLFLLEKVHRRLLRLQVPFTIAGWVLLLALFAYTTVLDIARYIVKAFV